MYKYILTNKFIIIVISTMLYKLLIYSIESISLLSKWKCLFNHIRCQILSDIIIVNDYKIFHCLVIMIKLTNIYYTKLFSVLKSLTNKHNNIIEPINWTFFLLGLNFFLYISNCLSIHYYYNQGFIILLI